jgi:hypothetical protein
MNEISDYEQELDALFHKMKMEMKALKLAVRKLDAAMDMQEKRETEEFHIPAATMWVIWQEARKLAEPYRESK